MKTILLLLTIISLNSFAQTAPWPFPKNARKPKVGFMAGEVGTCQADQVNDIAYPKHSYNESTPYKISSIDLTTTDNAELGAKLNIITSDGKKINLIIFSKLFTSHGSLSTSLYRAPTDAHHLDEALFKLEASGNGKTAKLTVVIKTNEGQSATTTYSCRLIK